MNGRKQKVFFNLDYTHRAESYAEPDDDDRAGGDGQQRF